MRSTKAVIYLDNLRHNIHEIRLKTKQNTALCVAVKANAYGHGAVQISKALLNFGVDCLAVATVEEGCELRINGIKCPILLLSLCAPEEVIFAVENRLVPLVFDSEYISLFDRAAEKIGVTVPVHLAVDTGMGRIGCLSNEALSLASQIAHSNHLVMGGICTHFALSDSVSANGFAYTDNQFKDFLAVADSICKAGINCGIRHCSSSAALINRPEMQLDMVRPGIISYGYYPGDISESYLDKKKNAIHLKPVMALETQVVAIRHFAAGKSVSYGCTWKADKETDIAVLPIGYADGLLRRFAPNLCVAINGKPYPVRGRICMDQCMVDIGKNNNDVKRWDKAVFFGPPESGALQTAEDIAQKNDTISYEIIAGIKSRVPRVFTT